MIFSAKLFNLLQPSKKIEQSFQPINPCIYRIKDIFKGIEFMPQTQIFWSQYLCNLMVQTFDISNFDYLYLRSTTLGYKDIQIGKSEFVAKTKFICFIFIELARDISEFQMNPENEKEKVKFTRKYLDDFVTRLPNIRLILA